MGNIVGRTLQIGEYRVKVGKQIGEGGFSFIHLAHDVDSRRVYALKRSVCQDTDSLSQATAEMNLMRRIPLHENLVRFLGCTTTRNADEVIEIFLLLEFCPGGSVASLLKTRYSQGLRLSEHEALTIFADACRAVCRLHEQNPPILHRDIKLENILIGQHGIHKLCDFGSASVGNVACTTRKQIQEQIEMIQQTTTMQFRAPEMLDLFRYQAVTTKADVWALGCVLYELVCGEHPFGEGDLQIINGVFRAPTSFECSGDVVRLIQRLLDTNPTSRPTAAEALETVMTILGEDVLCSANIGKPISVKGSRSRVESTHNTQEIPTNGIHTTPPRDIQATPKQTNAGRLSTHDSNHAPNDEHDSDSDNGGDTVTTEPHGPASKDGAVDHTGTSFFDIPHDASSAPLPFGSFVDDGTSNSTPPSHFHIDSIPRFNFPASHDVDSIATTSDEDNDGHSDDEHHKHNQHHQHQHQQQQQHHHHQQQQQHQHNHNHNTDKSNLGGTFHQDQQTKSHLQVHFAQHQGSTQDSDEHGDNAGDDWSDSETLQCVVAYVSAFLTTQPDQARSAFAASLPVNLRRLFADSCLLQAQSEASHTVSVAVQTSPLVSPTAPTTAPSRQKEHEANTLSRVDEAHLKHDAQTIFAVPRPGRSLSKEESNTKHAKNTPTQPSSNKALASEITQLSTEPVATQPTASTNTAETNTETTTTAETMTAEAMTAETTTTVEAATAETLATTDNPTEEPAETHKATEPEIDTDASNTAQKAQTTIDAQPAELPSTSHSPTKDQNTQPQADTNTPSDTDHSNTPDNVPSPEA